MLLDFDFLTEMYPWIHRIWKCECHDKKYKKIQVHRKFKILYRFSQNVVRNITSRACAFMHECIHEQNLISISQIRFIEICHRGYSKNSISHKILNRWSIFMKIVTNKEEWLLHWCAQFQLDISSRLWGIVVWKVKSRTHTPGHQLKIIFLEVSDYSEYSVSTISIFFHTAFSVSKKKINNRSHVHVYIWHSVHLYTSIFTQNKR